MADDQHHSHSSELQHTPLYDLHVDAGAKMVPFAGYSMPLQFSTGIIKEHIQTRTSASLFDVSHMGQLELHGPGVAAALETVLPIDVQDLPLLQSRYALLTNDHGGIRDDLMVTRWSDSCAYLVVNADCKAEDIAYLRASLPAAIELRPRPDLALLALQGPAARPLLASLVADVAQLPFMRAMSTQIAGYDCYISCSGYTGEDGFEISVAAEHADALARQLLALDGVEPAGLGARDSLRLEAGLCLYGHDLNTQTTPIEAGLAWSISAARRADGARAGGFPGAATILQQLADGPERRRVGLSVSGRAPVREGASLVDEDHVEVGRVSSGSFGPSAGVPLAMGYVASRHALPGTRLYALVRGKPREVVVTRLPFVTQRYFRG